MLQLMAAAVAAAAILGCGDNLGGATPVAPDASAVDAGADPLFGWPCPVASVPGIVYPCHYSAPYTPDGWCVQPPGSSSPACRPMCRDLAGVFCASVGGVVWQQDNGNGACVCVPRGG